MNIHEMLKLIIIMTTLLERKIFSTFTVCIATWSAVSPAQQDQSTSYASTHTMQHWEHYTQLRTHVLEDATNNTLAIIIHVHVCNNTHTHTHIQPSLLTPSLW